MSEIKIRYRELSFPIKLAVISGIMNLIAFVIMGFFYTMLLIDFLRV